MLMGCVVRAVETAGALRSDPRHVTVRYANERVAFEKPIGKFQAVQHNLARLAGEVSAAMTAAHSAADAIARGGAFDDAIFLEATAAKIRSAEAAQEGAAIAHQVHGAIGFTNEHILHRYTLRMLAWRDDFGNESHWAVALGNRDRGARRGRILAAGRGALTDHTHDRSSHLRSDPPAARMRRAAPRGARRSSPTRSRAARSIPRARPRRLAQQGIQPAASAPRAGSA